MKNRFLVKQPNGRYCVFSTIMNCPIYVNLTREDYINLCKTRAEKEAEIALQQVDEQPQEYNKFENIGTYFTPENMSINEFALYLLLMKRQTKEKEKFLVK